MMTIRDLIKELLEYEYFVNRITENELIQKYHYTSGISNFHKILKSIGIKPLTSKEAVQISFLLGRNGNAIIYNKYHSCWHTTWNNKKVYVRSSYELDFAKELDDKHINYEVESLRIKYFDTQKRKYRCAIPDFYIPDTNTIVEIKSNWTLDVENMKDKFTAYKELGYNCKLICEHKELTL